MKLVFKFVLFLMVTLLVQSCSTRRLVPDGKYLVTKNVVEIQHKKDEKTTFTKSDLAAFAGQRSNKQIFGTRFPLWVYYKTIKKTDRKFWKWINEHVGKEPIYYEKSLSNTGADQMERYLRNLGYFNADVKSSAKIKREGS